MQPARIERAQPLRRKGADTPPRVDRQIAASGRDGHAPLDWGHYSRSWPAVNYFLQTFFKRLLGLGLRRCLAAVLEASGGSVAVFLMACG